MRKVLLPVVLVGCLVAWMAAVWFDAEPGREAPAGTDAAPRAAIDGTRDEASERPVQDVQADSAPDRRSAGVETDAHEDRAGRLLVGGRSPGEEVVLTWRGTRDGEDLPPIFARTDGEGRFDPPPLEAGWSGVVRLPAALEALDGGESLTWIPERDAVETVLHARWRRALTGRVLDALTREATPRAEVESWIEFGSSARVSAATCDANGRFRIPLGAEPTTGGRVRAQHGELASAVVSVPGGVAGDVDLGDLLLRQRTRVAFLVRDEDGLPVEAAIARTFEEAIGSSRGPESVWSAPSDATGLIPAVLLPLDREFASISAFACDSVHVDVPPHLDGPLEVVLHRLGRVVVRLRAQDPERLGLLRLVVAPLEPEPFERAGLSLRSEIPGVASALRYLDAKEGEAEGLLFRAEPELTLCGLREGVGLRLQVQDATGRDMGEPKVVRVRGPWPQLVELEAPGGPQRVRLHVSDEQARSLAGVSVRIARVWFFGQTDEDGALEGEVWLGGPAELEFERHGFVTGRVALDTSPSSEASVATLEVVLVAGRTLTVEVVGPEGELVPAESLNAIVDGRAVGSVAELEPGRYEVHDLETLRPALRLTLGGRDLESQADGSDPFRLRVPAYGSLEVTFAATAPEGASFDQIQFEQPAPNGAFSTRLMQNVAAAGRLELPVVFPGACTVRRVCTVRGEERILEQAELVLRPGVRNRVRLR